MKRYKALLKKKGDGVMALSLVDFPATEQVAVLQSASNKLLFADEEKHLMTTAVLIPDTPVYRNSSFQLGECELVYDAEAIEQTAQKFMEKNAQAVTLGHNSGTIDGVSLVESWIKQDADKDKSNALGFDLPIGTWFVTHKISDQSIWDAAKKGDILGTSIEAFFSFEEVESINQNNMKKEKKNLFDAFKAFFAEDEEDKKTVTVEEEPKGEKKVEAEEVVVEEPKGEPIKVDVSSLMKAIEEAEVGDGKFSIEAEIKDGALVVSAVKKAEVVEQSSNKDDKSAEVIASLQDKVVQLERESKLKQVPTPSEPINVIAEMKKHIRR